MFNQDLLHRRNPPDLQQVRFYPKKSGRRRNHLRFRPESTGISNVWSFYKKEGPAAKL